MTNSLCAHSALHSGVHCWVCTASQWKPAPSTPEAWCLVSAAYYGKSSETLERPHPPRPRPQTTPFNTQNSHKLRHKCRLWGYLRRCQVMICNFKRLFRFYVSRPWWRQERPREVWRGRGCSSLCGYTGRANLWPRLQDNLKFSEKKSSYMFVLWMKYEVWFYLFIWIMQVYYHQCP